MSSGGLVEMKATPVWSMGETADTLKKAEAAGDHTEPEAKINYASVMHIFPWNLYHGHLNSLLSLGTRKSLVQTDLGLLPADIEPEQCFAKFNFAWLDEIAQHDSIEKRSLLRPLIRVIGKWRLAIVLVANLTTYLAAFGVPLLTQAILKSQSVSASSAAAETEENKLSNTTLGLYIGMILLVPMCNAVIRAQKDSMIDFMSIQMEASLKMATHRKVLTMGAVGQRTFSIGDITNMFSRDIRLACEILNNFSLASVPPIQVAIGLTLVYEIIGPAALTSLAAVFVLTPLQFVFGKMFIKRFRAYQAASGIGMKAKSELLAGVRGMKYNGWEGPFKELIRVLRVIEVGKLLLYHLYQTPATVLGVVLPITLPVMAFYTYVSIDAKNEMTYVKAITVLMLYEQIVSALQQVPTLINQLLEAKASLERIRQFLCSPDLPNHITKLSFADTAASGSGEQAGEKETGKIAPKSVTVIEFQNATLGWFLPQDLLDIDSHKKEREEQGLSAGPTEKRGETQREPNSNPVPERDSKAAVTEAESNNAEKYAAVSNIEESDSSDIATNVRPNANKTDRSVYTLRDISFSIKENELVGIVGPVGAGKSSLLAALIGELQLHENEQGEIGKVCLREDSSGSRRLAYTQQQPWIFNASLKSNILFGEKYDEQRFRDVIGLCCLRPDIDMLPNDVDTEIGERGINLSGGQKARVSLARAIYKSSADTILLDDPLSAVDAHTADHLFHQAIFSDLVKRQRKTVLLVTHQIHFLPYCDKVLVLDSDGRMSDFGTYQEVLQGGRVELLKLVDIEEVQVVKVDEAHSPKAEDPAPSSTELIRTSSFATTDISAANIDKSSDNRDDLVTATATAAEKASAENIVVSVSEGPDALSGENEMSKLPPAPSQKPSSNPGTKSKGKGNEIKDKDKGQNQGLITKEKKASKGTIGWDVYLYYIRGGGSTVFTLIVLVVIAGEISKVLANYVIVDWGKAQTAVQSGQVFEGSGVTSPDLSDHNLGTNSAQLTTKQNLYFVATFSAYLCGDVISVFCTQMMKILFTQRGAWYFHDQLVHTLLYAPVVYYDTTPIGRILNLFSNDMRSMNARLFNIVLMTLQSMCMALSGVCMISIATSGTALIVLIPLGYLYYKFLIYYRSTNTELYRLSSIAFSPIIVEFTQTLYSLVSLRAYASQNTTIQSMNKKIHTLNSTGRIQNMVKQWLAVRLETMGATITFFCVLIQVVSKGYVSPTAMALAVLYAQTLPRLCDYFLRSSAFLEAAMASVERVKHAIDTVPQENYEFGRSYTGPGYGADRKEKKVALAVISNASNSSAGRNDKDGITQPSSEEPSAQALLPLAFPVPAPLPTMEPAGPVTVIPPDDWPTHGIIEVSNLSMRYSNKKNNPLVLKNVNFSVNSCEKVGIAGRTGCGKSSLMVALFQIEKCEPGTCIKIDGIDILTVPLSVLRSRIGIIMQESLLFSETLRFNIDPFHQYTDAQIWEVLDVVSLKPAVVNMLGMLDAQIAEGGSNLSHGQRQLICFARAILRKCKVLILDEATASIDNDNDERIQALLKERFKDSTILTIAHRLNTIIDYDRVLIMSDGAVKEFDAPHVLLASPDGAFRSLWDQFKDAHKE